LASIISAVLLFSEGHWKRLREAQVPWQERGKSCERAALAASPPFCMGKAVLLDLAHAEELGREIAAAGLGTAVGYLGHHPDTFDAARRALAGLSPSFIIGQVLLPARAIVHSFLQGGFKCSTHRMPSGRRLDVISATRHAMLRAPERGGRRRKRLPLPRA
jgi:hypothetical protein